MSSRIEEMDEPEGVVKQTLSITPTQLQDYAGRHGFLGACEVCGKTSWVFPAQNGEPGLYMTYSVRDTSVADWLFHIICSACGNTRLINAGYVWRYVFQHKEAAE